jgi:formylglycine-generating enzyme required for sulfatase activity/tRNA A-37 threonylcarbamoyl transferase component Bud32
VTGDGTLAEQLGAALGDDYEVIRSLGEGGFAIVFLVRDKSLKRDLAVKVLSPELITSRNVLDRFRREAETIAQLSHPNIVPLHFIGQKDDLLYLAMQCVAGGSIGDRLAREGPLPADDVVRIVSDVASALAHAHKRGVIHRDIKPANVLVDADSGRCLVTDFGIARSSDAANLTATGVMLGTPAYLSPEQVTGEKLDHRVDIYALGVMAYELLTARVPFQAPTATAAMMKRLAGPPDPVTTLRANVPPHVADAITQCLAVDPADRPQTADDVIQAFGGNRVTTGGRVTSGAPPTWPRSRGRFPLVAFMSVATLIAVGAIAYVVANRRAAAAPPGAGLPDTNMVVIPAGDYIIGTDSGFVNARPRHTEHVAQFRIGRTEVTVGDYQTFIMMTNAPSPWPGGLPSPKLPVTHVPWGDAANYCAWKYRPGGRLPTEVEWEAAARGREGRAYPSGNHLEPASANTASAQRDGPAPVGSFPRGATPEGLQDMSGNVWEWTSSPMAAYPGGRPMPDSLARYRVIRGGAFDTNDSVATAWWRGYVSATSAPAALPNTGFRCVSP